MFAVQKALDEKGGQGAASLPSHLASFTGVTITAEFIALFFIFYPSSFMYKCSQNVESSS
jgi:hypothetical protein